MRGFNIPLYAALYCKLILSYYYKQRAYFRVPKQGGFVKREEDLMVHAVSAVFSFSLHNLTKLSNHIKKHRLKYVLLYSLTRVKRLWVYLDKPAWDTTSENDIVCRGILHLTSINVWDIIWRNHSLRCSQTSDEFWVLSISWIWKPEIMKCEFLISQFGLFPPRNSVKKKKCEYCEK